MDAQSDFDKKFVTKKAGQVEPFLSKYALKVQIKSCDLKYMLKIALWHYDGTT